MTGKGEQGMNAEAQGRLYYGEPIAIIDIGSNSVRLVAYEGLSRSPTPIFNEKVMCGLGKKVLSTGRLADDAMAKALAALARFRVLVETMGIKQVKVIATAAARDAANDNIAKALSVSDKVGGAMGQAAGAKMRIAVQEAFIDGMHVGLYVAAALVIVCAVVVFAKYPAEELHAENVH